MTDHQPGCGCTRCDQRRQCDAEFPITPPRKVEFIIDLKATIEQNESLNKENANLRAVISAFHEIADSNSAKPIVFGKYDKGISVGWRQASSLLRELEKQFFGREVTP